MSDRLVPENLWKFTMGDMPMPEDCTFDVMNVMYDVVRRMENRDYAVEQIAWYESLWRKYKPSYDLAAQHKDESEESAEKYEIYSQIMKMIKDGILLFREWLAE